MRTLPALLWHLLSACGAPEAPPPPPPPPTRPAWVPPMWLGGGSLSPWVLEMLSQPPRVASGPALRSRAAFVADLDRGEVLWSRDADRAHPVASLTKLVSALAFVREEPRLGQELCAGPEQDPPRPGGRSRFVDGACHSGWDWLGAALVASDNRGAMGLPALSGLPYEAFLSRMGDVGLELGLEHARWVDPTGILVENEASVVDVARLIVAAASHPTLAPIVSADTWSMDVGQAVLGLPTTNRLAQRWETLAAKTGYTDPAGYCFAAVVRGDTGATYAIALLGAPTSGARFDDAARLVAWAERLPSGADGGAPTPEDDDAACVGAGMRCGPR